MRDEFTHELSERRFKWLTIVGCAGTLVFLLLEAYRENFGEQYKHWQAAYAARLSEDLRATFEVGVKQAFLPELGRVDRCQSCHVGIDDPNMAAEALPLRTHPGTILSTHPVESFGCTVCHQGQGRAMGVDSGHGEVAHWEEPLLRDELVYTSCGRCHAEPALYGNPRDMAADPREIFTGELAASLPGAAILTQGKRLVSDSGCLGCHVFAGRGGTLGPELTVVGDKGPHGYDFSHLPPGVERTPLAWLEQHFMDPGAISPGTVMPEVAADAAGAKALAAYMLALRSRDVPSRYRPAYSQPPGRSASGEELYRLFCVACHGSDLAGSDVPEIRTPSLSNEAFLSVATREYLTYIVANGRSGTEMPAWRGDAGGLTDTQLARVVDYLLSYAPERATLADVLRTRGEARFGAALYRGNCAGCHGKRGEGGIGTRLASTEFLSLASDEFLVETILAGRPQTGMPSWGGFDSQEVADLVAFLRTWQRPKADAPAVVELVAAGGVDAEVGRSLYRSNCAACHGANAEGSVGPSLNHPDFLSMASDAYLAHAIVDGRPGSAMPAWHDLSTEDVADLVAHLRGLSSVPYAPPPARIAQGDPETGAVLFQRACAACHGEQAVGGTGPALRNPVFLAHANDGFLQRTIAFGRWGTAMRGFLKGGTGPDGQRVVGAAGVAEFSEAQIADVVAWLRSLQHQGPASAVRRSVLGSPSRGRELYEGSAGCASCHGRTGEGGVGPAIGNVAFHEVGGEGFLIGTMVLGRSGTEMRHYGASGMADLDPEELMDVAAYVRTLGATERRGREGWRVYMTTADQVDFGRELYGSYCVGCHGENGRGNYAPELNNPEFLRAASDGFLLATIARGRDETPMRAFAAGHSGLADLGHEELRALVGFLRSWDTAPDDRAPSSESPKPPYPSH